MHQYWKKNPTLSSQYGLLTLPHKLSCHFYLLHVTILFIAFHWRMIPSYKLLTCIVVNTPCNLQLCSSASNNLVDWIRNFEYQTPHILPLDFKYEFISISPKHGQGHAKSQCPMVMGILPRIKILQQPLPNICSKKLTRQRIARNDIPNCSCHLALSTNMANTFTAIIALGAIIIITELPLEPLHISKQSPLGHFPHMNLDSFWSPPLPDDIIQRILVIIEPRDIVLSLC